MSKLALNNVTYTYKRAEKPAVSNVNYVFEEGKLYAIIGPSGSGKSTLLSLLTGLDIPSYGEILFNDENIHNMDLDRYRRECISMIFQDFHLFPLLTALENVCFPMQLRGISLNDSKQKAKELLDMVGITPEQTNRFPSKLSGGEQQRVAIARSIATNAKIILADEPTGNLDVDNTEQVLRIFRSLVDKEGHCIIIVTHDLEVAEAADVKCKMKGGELTIY